MSISKTVVCTTALVLSGLASASEYAFPALTDEVSSDAAWGATPKPTANDRILITTSGRSFTFADDFMMGGIKLNLSNATNSFAVADGKTISMPMGLYHNQPYGETTLTNGVWDFKSATYGTVWTQSDNAESRATPGSVIRINHAVLTNVTAVKLGNYARGSRIVIDNQSKVYSNQVIPAPDYSKCSGIEVRGGSKFFLKTANNVLGSTGSENGYLLVSGEGSLYTNVTGRQIFCRKSTNFVFRAENGGKMFLGDGAYYLNQTPSVSNRIEAVGGYVEFTGDLVLPQVNGPHDNWIDVASNGTFVVTGNMTLGGSNNYIRASSGGTAWFKGKLSSSGTFSLKSRDSMFIMDNGTIKAPAYFTVDANAAYTNNVFVFRGANPRLQVATHFYPRNGTRFRFEIPADGYEDGARITCHDFPESPRVFFDFAGLVRFQGGFRGVKTMTLVETTFACIQNLKKSVDLTNQELDAAGYKDISLSLVGNTKVVLSVKGKPGLVLTVR